LCSLCRMIVPTSWLCHDAVIASGRLHLQRALRGPVILLLGLFAGVVGSLVDSFLGATLQFSGYDTERNKVVSKPGDTVERICGRLCLTNSQVNLVSASVTAALTTVLALRVL
jgi:uncharacterized membrane protein